MITVLPTCSRRPALLSSSRFTLLSLPAPLLAKERTGERDLQQIQFLPAILSVPAVQVGVNRLVSVATETATSGGICGSSSGPCLCRSLLATVAHGAYSPSFACMLSLCRFTPLLHPRSPIPVSCHRLLSLSRASKADPLPAHLLAYQMTQRVASHRHSRRR